MLHAKVYVTFNRDDAGILEMCERFGETNIASVPYGGKNSLCQTGPSGGGSENNVRLCIGINVNLEIGGLLLPCYSAPAIARIPCIKDRTTFTAQNTNIASKRACDMSWHLVRCMLREYDRRSVFLDRLLGISNPR